MVFVGIIIIAFIGSHIIAYIKGAGIAKKILKAADGNEDVAAFVVSMISNDLISYKKWVKRGGYSKTHSAMVLQANKELGLLDDETTTAIDASLDGIFKHDHDTIKHNNILRAVKQINDFGFGLNKDPPTMVSLNLQGEVQTELAKREGRDISINELTALIMLPFLRYMDGRQFPLFDEKNTTIAEKVLAWLSDAQDIDDRVVKRLHKAIEYSKNNPYDPENPDHQQMNPLFCASNISEEEWDEDIKPLAKAFAELDPHDEVDIDVILSEVFNPPRTKEEIEKDMNNTIAWLRQLEDAICNWDDVDEETREQHITDLVDKISEVNQINKIDSVDQCVRKLVDIEENNGSYVLKRKVPPII